MKTNEKKEIEVLNAQIAKLEALLATGDENTADVEHPTTDELTTLTEVRDALESLLKD